MDIPNPVPANDYVESIRAQAIDSILTMMAPLNPQPQAA